MLLTKYVRHKGLSTLYFSTLVAQAIALVVVVGSYFAARLQSAKIQEEEELAGRV